MLFLFLKKSSFTVLLKSEFYNNSKILLKDFTFCVSVEGFVSLSQRDFMELIF